LYAVRLYSEVMSAGSPLVSATPPLGSTTLTSTTCPSSQIALVLSIAAMLPPPARVRTGVRVPWVVGDDEPWWERRAREPLDGFAQSRLRIVFREARAAARRSRAVDTMVMARKVGASYELIAKVSGLSVKAVRTLLGRPRPRFTGVDPDTLSSELGGGAGPPPPREPS
jgi:hypothetical protein